jgi:Family of unknown function (DUF6412)
MVLTAPSRSVLRRSVLRRSVLGKSVLGTPGPARTAPGRTAPAETAPGVTGLGWVLAVLCGLSWATLVPSGPPALAVTMLAGAVLAGVLAACLAGGAGLARLAAAVPLVSRAAALREKSWRAAFTRQRDPDAAGRPRPRAPSAAPAAARFSGT